MRYTSSRTPAPVAVLLGVVAMALAAPAPSGAQTPDTLQPDTAAAQAPEPLGAELQRSDEAIRSRLQAIYDRIGSLRGIDVQVEAGIVRLEGRALSLEARQDAVDLARETEGVVFVEDRVRVVTDLSRRLDPALDRIRDYALDAVAFVPLLAVALVILLAFALFGRWASEWDGPHLRVARTPFVRGLLRQAIGFGFALVGLFVALELLDATALVGAVLGTAGVFGLALGFAFKDIVENHLAGIMLSLRQPFAPSDHILVGEHEGKVVRLTARETILMTLDGNHVRIPNAELFRSAVTNYTRNPRRRFRFTLGVGPADDLALARESGVEVLRDMDGVMDDPPPASQILEVGESWVSVQFFGWVDQTRADFLRVRSEAIRLVKAGLEEAGVTLPSPEYLVALQGARAPEVAASEAPARGAAPSPGTPAPQEDVSVDTTLDEQIEEDRRASTEADLLEGDERSDGP